MPRYNQSYLIRPAQFRDDLKRFRIPSSVGMYDQPNSPQVSGSSSMSSSSRAVFSEAYSSASDFLSSPSHSRSNSLGLSFAVEEPETSSAVPQSADTENSEDVPELSPTDTVQHLLSLFFDNVHHLAFPYPVHRFRRRLSLPQSDTRSPHQTLVYAILAFACHFASGRVASQQECFITKARSGLCDSSGRSAKPRDYILAGSILARAVLFRGDAAAALRLSFDAVQTSLRLGVDRSTSAVGSTPRSGEKDAWLDAKLWTTVCTIDLEVAFENGSSPNIPEQALATLHAQGTADTPPSRSPRAAREGGAVRMHAVLLLHRALRIRASILDGSVSVTSASFASEFRVLSYSLMRFRHSLPPIEAAYSNPPPFTFQFLSSRDNSLSSRITQNANIHTLSFAHLIAMGAAIALHGLVGLETANCREIASHAAKDMAKLLSALDNVSDPVLHSSIGLVISMAIRILLEDMSTRREDDSSVWTEMINLSHIDVLRGRLASLSVTFPTLRTELTSIDAQLAS